MSRWLAWLAQTMKQQAQPEFSIEHLQPAALNPGQKLLYRVGVFSSGSVLFFFALMLRHGLVELIPEGPFATAAVTAVFPWLESRVSPFQQDAVFVVTLSVAAGVILASRRHIRAVETVLWSASARAGLNYLTYAGLQVGLLAGATSRGVLFLP
jgi:hypothetical protein